MMDLGSLVEILALLSIGHAMEEDNPVFAERRLFESLFNGYNREVMPKYNRSEPITVSFGLKLRSIDKIDEKRQTFSIRSFKVFSWLDDVLKWDPGLFSNITVIRVNGDRLWVPSVVLYNAVEQYEYTGKTVTVHFDGHATVWTDEKLTVSCKLDVLTYPFDRQSCTLKFEPWYNNAAEMKVTKLDSPFLDDELSDYKENSEWTLLQIDTSTAVKNHSGMLFSGVLVTIDVQRKYLYHVFYTAVPVVCTSLLSLACFILPTENGERISLGVSLCLALAVLMTIVNTNMPETSDQIAVFGVYVALQLFWSVLTVFMTSISAKLYYGRNTGKEASRFLKLLTPSTGAVAHKENVNQCNIMDDVRPTTEIFTMKAVGSCEEVGDSKGQTLDSTYDEDVWKLASRRLDSICLAMSVVWSLILNIITACVLFFR